MVLNPISDGAFTGTALVAVKQRKLGAICISADGTNTVTVIITNPISGKRIFELATKSPAFLYTPIVCEAIVSVSVSGTGGLAFLYEWVD